MNAGLNFLLAAACGTIVANIYYAQPLVGPISQSLALPMTAAGLIVTLTQMGYGAGVLLLVPLGDLIENRKFILTNICILVIALLTLANTTQLVSFFIVAFAIGLFSSTVQVIIPYAASLASDLTRGRVVGNCTSGLLTGIMIARPTASFITNTFGWHDVFYFSSTLMILLAFILAQKLPERKPTTAGLQYRHILISMGRLFLKTPILRRRGFYQACQFGAFSLFWTTTPLILAKEFHLSQAGIALFALAGVAGAVSAPLAGRFADRGWSKPITGLGLLSVAISFLITHFSPTGNVFGLTLFVLSGILLDAGVSAVLVLGQRAIFSLDEKSRSRLNGLFVAMIFMGGAVGSAIGAWAYVRGGWALASWIGVSLPLLALLFFLTEL